MDELAGTFSRHEQHFDRLRRRGGLVLAPLVFAVLWALPLSGWQLPAHRLLAVFGLVVALWITEAIPLAVTALLGPTLCVLCGVGTEQEVFRSFGNPIVFLFLGSFILAQAMLRHGLNRRIAFQILGLHWVERSPARILVAFGCIAAFLSLWISNTTATAMMFPIAVAVLTEMARRQSAATGREVKVSELKFGTGLMLTAAFASSIGGMGTPVGSPPNLIGIGLIEKATGLRITFFQWMAFALPMACVLVAVLVVYLNWACAAETALAAESADWIKAERAKLGPLTRGERNVLLAFGCTVCLWLLPGAVSLVAGTDSPCYRWLLAHVPEGVAALLGAALLFVLPVNLAEGEFTVSWADAKHIDWGTILLFGGGLAMGDAMFSTGLAEKLGRAMVDTLNVDSSLGLTALFALLGILLTETTSNTATANMVVPVAIAVAHAAGLDPTRPALAACLGASLAFMLPVSTPPNAIVFGSGCVPLLKMVRHGLILDLVSFVVVIVAVQWLVPCILP